MVKSRPYSPSHRQALFINSHTKLIKRLVDEVGREVWSFSDIDIDGYDKSFQRRMNNYGLIEKAGNKGRDTYNWRVREWLPGYLEKKYNYG